MNINGERILSLHCKSRTSRRNRKNKDEIEKEFIRNRLTSQGKENQYAKNLIYGTSLQSDLYISETDRFNRNFEKQELLNRIMKTERDHHKRENKLELLMSRRKNNWKKNQDVYKKQSSKRSLKNFRICNNPKVYNNAFDPLSPRYKDTNQGK